MGQRRAPGGGRKPLPTAVRVLRGNAGKRAIRALAAHESTLRHGVPDPPRHLDAMERRHWHRIGRELDELGVLAKTDRTSLEMLVRAYVRWIRCRTKVHTLGEVLEHPNSGKLYRNPWAVAAERAWHELVRMCIEYGVTPSSRTRVSAVAATAAPSAAPDGGSDAGTRYFGSA